jgi:hypothetical protein
MDLFLAGGFAAAVVVLLAAFALAAPGRWRPLLMGSAALVGAALAAQVLIGLYGAQTARLTLLAAAFLTMVALAVLIFQRRQHS